MHERGDRHRHGDATGYKWNGADHGVRLTPLTSSEATSRPWTEQAVCQRYGTPLGETQISYVEADLKVRSTFCDVCDVGRQGAELDSCGPKTRRGKCDVG